MKHTIPIIVSLACVAVQALPIPDDPVKGGVGVNNLRSETRNFLGSVTNDLGKLLGTLAVRSKRGLLDGAVGIGAVDGFLNTVSEDVKDNDVNKVIDDAYKTIVARSPDEETEDETDCSETEDSAEDDSTSDQNDPVESSGETGDDAGDAVPNEPDDSSLVDDSSLTANDAENAVSAEAGDQTDLSRRTVGLGINTLRQGIEGGIVEIGQAVDSGLEELENDIQFA